MSRMMTEATLCLPVRGEPPGEVLLGLKKSGFGAGKYVGLGGKVEAGETVAEAAARELAEEAGLWVAPADLEPRGHLTFLFPARPEWNLAVHLFVVRAWRGEARESAEMRPAWFHVDQVPYAGMWPDAQHWLPPLLAGRRVRARFTYEADNETLGAARVSTDAATEAPARR